MPPASEPIGGANRRYPNVAARVSDQPQHLHGGQPVSGRVDVQWARGFYLREILGGGKSKQPRSSADPPFAASRLQRNLLKNPPGVCQSIRHEPMKALVVKNAEPLLCLGAGRAFSVNKCAEANLACAIAEDRIPRGDASLFIPGEKAVTLQLHRSGHVRSQPKVAVHIFVQGSDFPKGQAVALSVDVKALF